MNIQDNKNAPRDAIAAAQQYVNIKKECRRIHDAYIGISVNGKDRHGVRKVFVNVTDENVEIIIEDLHTLCNHNTNRFTPETDDISIINNTLQIKPKAPLFGLDVIEITAK